MTEPAPSPFLPGTRLQVAWDSTSLGMLKTCPRLYYYTIIEGWTSREESVHLRFGIEYHAALQDYDLSRAAGITHNDALHDVIRELLLRTADFDPDHKSKTRESLVRTVVWYLDQFKNDPAETVILSDGKPAVEQSFRFELDWGPPEKLITDYVIGGASAAVDIHYILCGHLDRLVRYNDELFVMDRKTTTWTLGASYFAQYEPHNQMTLYTLASQIVLGTAVKGVIIDAARIAESTSDFARGFTFRSQDQLEEWLNDLHYWFALAEQYATIGIWPMNDVACDKFGGCKFRSVCSKSPSVRQRFLEGTFTKLEESAKWNPLRPR